MRGRYVQKVDFGGIWSVSGRRFDNVNVFYCACTHIRVLVECWHLTEAHRSLSTQMEYSKNRKLFIYFTQHNDTRACACACACAITIDDDDDVCVCVCACVWLRWMIVIDWKMRECALILLWVEVGSGGEQCSLQASAAGKNLGEWTLKILISSRNSHDFVGFCKQSFFMTWCQQILTNQTRRFPEPRNTQLIQVTRGHRYIFDTCVCVRVRECMRVIVIVCVSVGESRVIVRCEHV